MDRLEEAIRRPPSFLSCLPFIVFLGPWRLSINSFHFLVNLKDISSQINFLTT